MSKRTELNCAGASAALGFVFVVLFLGSARRTFFFFSLSLLAARLGLSQPDPRP